MRIPAVVFRLHDDRIRGAVPYIQWPEPVTANVSRETLKDLVRHSAAAPVHYRPGMSGLFPVNGPGTAKGPISGPDFCHTRQ